MDRRLLIRALGLLTCCAAVTVSGQWTELLMTVYDSSTQRPSLHRVGGGDPAVWVQQKADQSNLSVTVTTLRDAQQPAAMAISYRTNDVLFINSNNSDVTLFDTITNISYSGYSSASLSTAAMAVDWVAQNVYWVDPSFNWIRVAAISKRALKVKTTIIYTNIDTPSGLAVIPALSYLFWSELSATVGPKIERTDLSGQNRVVLTRDVTAPVALSVDYGTNRVYWLDSGRQTLESMLWDGSDRRTFNIGLSLTSLVVYGNYVYTLGPTNALIVFDKMTGAKFKTFIDSSSKGGISIAIATSTAQPPMTSPCSTASCPQLCVGSASNTTTVCLCDETYTLPPDNNASLCDAFAAHPVYIGSELLVLMNVGTSAQHVGGWDVTTLESADLFSSRITYFYMSAHCTNLDFIYSRRLVYGAGGNVVSVTSATSGMITDYTVGAGLFHADIRSISVDWLSSNIYWVDGVLQYIVVARYDLSYTRMFSQPVRYPTSICVDSIGRRLFWTSSVPSIGVMGLDGSNVTTLVTLREPLSLGPTSSPQSLAFDNLHQRLYWKDNGRGTVESVNPDGSGRATFATAFVGQSMGLTVFQDFVLWTDSSRKTLNWGLTTNTTGGALGSFTFSSNTPYAVTVYSGQSQPSDAAAGPCTVNNGGCSQLCLPDSGSSRTCQCAVGYTSTDDGVTCQTNVLTAPFLLLLDTCLGGIYQMNTATGDIQALQQVSRQVTPLALAYDSVTSTVFWSDVQLTIIKSLSLSTGVEQIFPFTVPASLRYRLAIYGMAADSAGRQLYFTDRANDIVGRLPLDGGGVVTVLVNTGSSWRLSAIVLAPDDQLMFWADEGATSQIVRANMDGSQVTTIISGTDVVAPSALAIDTATRTLYWADLSTMRVESATFNGSRTLIYQSWTGNYLRLSVDSNYIYLIGWNTRGVTRISRSGGGNPEPFGQQEFICLHDVLYAAITTSSTTTRTTTTNPTTTTTASSSTTITTSPTTTTTVRPTTTTTTSITTPSTSDTPPSTTATLQSSTTVTESRSTTSVTSPATTTTTETSSPGFSTTHVIIVCVAGVIIVVACVVALTVCIIKKKGQMTATVGHSYELPQPSKVESPSHIYETIDHVTKDNLYTDSEPHYIVPPPRNLIQSNDTYTPLVNIAVYRVTGEPNMAYEMHPSPPPAYTPSSNEPINH